MHISLRFTFIIYPEAFLIHLAVTLKFHKDRIGPQGCEFFIGSSAAQSDTA